MNTDIWKNEIGSTYPLIISVMLFILVLLMTALSISEMAVERTHQQGSADLGALAGANVLSKSADTVRLINLTIWARNTTLDALYLGAAIASVSSAGSATAAFKVPLEFQKATIKPVEALEKVRVTVATGSAIGSAVNGMSIIKANNQDNYGAVIPLPLGPQKSGPGQRQKDLKKMIETYGQRIDQARGEMDQAIAEYESSKAELNRSGQNAKPIKKDPFVMRLRSKVHETSGRVGGLMSQRNRRRRELAELEGKNTRMLTGQDKVVAVVYHPSSVIPFTNMFGGIKTGDSVALAAAMVADTSDDIVIGEQAVEELFSSNPILRTVGTGLTRMLEAVNLVGRKGRNLDKDYGLVGSAVKKALDRIGVMPPSITQTRPALVSVDEALEAQSQIYQLLRKVKTEVK